MTTQQVDEDDYTRVVGYATQKELQLIDQAFKKSGRRSRSSFLVNAATKRAKEVLHDEATDET